MFKIGDMARLVSPVQAKNDGKCLYFWYHAYGAGKSSTYLLIIPVWLFFLYTSITPFCADVATLNVYSEKQVNATNNPRTKIWSIDRNQGNDWFIARIPTDYDTDYKIIFEVDNIVPK